MYQQDTGIARSAASIPSMTQPSISMPMSIPFTPTSIATVDPTISMNIPASGPAMPMTLLMSLLFASFASVTYGLDSNMPNQPSGHRDSFGLVSPRSQGNTQDSGDGNGGHNGHSGFHGGSTGFRYTMQGATTATFNIGIKPKILPHFIVELMRMYPRGSPRSPISYI